MTAAGQKAGAYISSWGAWASEKKKGWGSAKGDESGKENGGGGGKERIEGEGAGSGAGVGVVGTPKRDRKRQERGDDGIGRLDA